MNATLRATRLLAWHMAQGRGAMNYSASAGGDKYFYMDKIRLSGLLFHGFHGVLPEENTLGQKFRVDAVMYVGQNGLQAAGQSDNLDETVNYAETHRRIQAIVEGKPQKLIETVAEKIAQAILQNNSTVQATQVTVSKPHVSLPSALESVQVEIFRTSSS